MDNNEIILQPEITGSVNVKIGKVTKMNFLYPEDDSDVNNINILVEKDKELIQNLKCCGNCRYSKISHIPPHTSCWANAEISIASRRVCIKWEWDCFTNSDRLLGD